MFEGILGQKAFLIADGCFQGGSFPTPIDFEPLDVPYSVPPSICDYQPLDGVIPSSFHLLLTAVGFSPFSSCLHLGLSAVGLTPFPSNFSMAVKHGLQIS